MVRDLWKVPGPSIRDRPHNVQYGGAYTKFTITRAQKLSDTSSPSHVISGYMMDYLNTHTMPEPEYDGTNANMENVWKSLNKLMAPPTFGWDETIMERAMRLTYRQLKDALEQGPCTSPEYTRDSRPALWWKYYGYSTKEEVLSSQIFWEAYNECIRGVRNFPPYSVSGKREFLLKDEILKEKKIRTFVLESLELVVEHHFLWGNQNKYLSEHQPGYIRYGINLHDGGFHKMITESWRSFWLMLDVSGWDRKFPLARKCQELRLQGMEEWYRQQGCTLPDELRARIERANAAYCSPNILLPTGDVVELHWGQVSGSVLTTSNNCIGHNIIENYKLITACPRASDDEIVSQGANLYGDDNLGSYDEMFAELRKESFHAMIYSHFGMTVKAGSFVCKDDPEGLSFLGGTCRTFKYCGKIYFIPSYAKNRIYTGLQWSLEPLAPDDELMKCFSLLELGWEECYDHIVQYLKYLMPRVPETAVSRSFKTKGIPSRDELRLKWAGFGK